MSAALPAKRPLSVFIVAGEESGDQLGSRLMRALAERLDGAVRFAGVGGSTMTSAGLQSLFPMEEISLHGISAVIARVPQVYARFRQTTAAVIAGKPDVLVVIDSPDFNLRVARRVRRQAPAIPIVDYVSPSVWAWRPGRARRMAPFVDHLLAILPFEPDVHRRLGGPPCTYVGHPLMERLASLRPAAGERRPIGAVQRTLLVLPGSRHSEVSRLLDPFGEALARIARREPGLEVVLPAVPRFAEEIREKTKGWVMRPTIVTEEAGKLAAFRRAHAALAASGTVTLELALAGVPMVVAYRIDPIGKLFKPIIRAQSRAPVKSIVLPNLMLGEFVVPELIDRDSSPEQLAAALLPLLHDSPERRRQVEAFERLDSIMSLGGETPSEKAADIVLSVAMASGRDRRTSV